ncbi:MAG: ABC transporter ATP-binding protein, partial [Lentisphaeria bacterium]|nr:ABC transporter ATP-binding protein [Lentisphaeria bacterium]
QSASATLQAGALVLIALFALRTAYLMGSYYIQDRITRNRQVELSHRLFAAYMAAPYQFHLRRNSAELLRNAALEVERVISEVLNPLLTVLRQGIVIVAVVAMVVWVEPLIGLAALALIGCAGVGFLWCVDASLKRAGETEQAMRGAQYRTVNEGLAVFKELRIMGREGGFTRLFHHFAESMARAQRWRDTARRSTWPIMEFVVVAGLLLVMGAMIRGGRGIEAIMPTLAFFTVALGRLKGCATEFVGGFAQVRYSLASVEAVADDLAELGAGVGPLLPPPAAPLSMKPDSVVELSHVSFRYLPDRPEVLHDVSLRIPCGACIGFVGPTGSGKSTILDLVMGILQPDQGRILLDGEDLQPRLRSWQATIGYIPQQITLLDDSVAANVALGVPPEQWDRAAIEAAIAAAQLRETVAELPLGIATKVGERGVRISGGQRQRIAIARALYHQPHILVMDEGTSSLDTETERAVVESVHALKGERTILMVAHRLSTVRECDTIFYVKDGRIEARGTYEELRASHEGFRRLTGA